MSDVILTLALLFIVGVVAITLKYVYISPRGRGGSSRRARPEGEPESATLVE